jgi:hypothetical protein
LPAASFVLALLQAVLHQALLVRALLLHAAWKWEVGTDTPDAHAQIVLA